MNYLIVYLLIFIFFKRKLKKLDKYDIKFVRRGERKIDNTYIMRIWINYKVRDVAFLSLVFMWFYVVIIDYYLLKPRVILVYTFLKILISIYGSFWLIIVLIMAFIIGKMY